MQDEETIGLGDVMKAKGWADKHPALMAAASKLFTHLEAMSGTPEGKQIIADLKDVCAEVAKL